MPQLARDVVKERARRLREKGEAALRAPSRTRKLARAGCVLTERGGIGRTEQFTPVRLTAPVAPGIFLDLTIADHDGRQLLAA